MTGENEKDFPQLRRALVGEIVIQTVDARELHGFLEVRRDFSNWIRGRIDRYGFIRGSDFEVSAQSGENPQGGRPALEYVLSIDMAKELAMVERTSQGRRVRRYFIACERLVKDALSISDHAVLNVDLGTWNASNFPNWPIEVMRERRVLLATYRRQYGQLGGSWAMVQLGFPLPPSHLFRGGVQHELELFAGSGGSVAHG